MTPRPGRSVEVQDGRLSILSGVGEGTDRSCGTVSEVKLTMYEQFYSAPNTGVSACIDGLYNLVC